MSKIEWHRTGRLTPSNVFSKESWALLIDGEERLRCPVLVDRGKPLDVRGLKGAPIGELIGAISEVRNSVKDLYGDSARLVKVQECPCCGTASGWDTVATIHTVPYVQCDRCLHVFVGRQPVRERIERVFTDSMSLASTYVDPVTIRLRLDQVVRPKLDWVEKVFDRSFCGSVTSVVDVGAGGGHFVHACKDREIEVKGFEINQSAIQFAKAAFDVALVSENFLECRTDAQPPDVLTFWGLLEYTPNPYDFLSKARGVLSDSRGMLIVEVPRFESISSAVQNSYSHNVFRHLDPGSHLNCFTDSSICTILTRAGFRPVAVWYFGMDAYEWLVQSAMLMESGDLLEKGIASVDALQKALDSASLCDDLVIAAVPDPDVSDAYGPS